METGKIYSVFLVFVVLGLLISAPLIQAPPAAGFSGQNHKQITSNALQSFLKPPIYADIEDEHAFVDSIYQFVDKYHFDNCAFQGGTQQIFNNYLRAVANLNPAAPDVWDATDAFGQILHPAQDFYAHANWIELGQTNLIDSRLINWAILFPFTPVGGGIIVVQGENADLRAAGYTGTIANKIVTLTSAGGSTTRGLVSGSAYWTDDCPDSVDIGHWDGFAGSWPPHGLFGPSGLSKDDNSRTGFGAAFQLAQDQTVHEWCRLVNLVELSYGQPGVRFLFNNWVSDEAAAKSACPMLDLSYIGIEEDGIENGGGCLIATAVYGSELAPQVQFLREVRDNTVLSTYVGTSFMESFNQFYYSFSPTVADWERENPVFQQVVRLFITPMMSTFSIMNLADSGSEAGVLGLGISVILLNFGMYVAAPALIILKVVRGFKKI